MRNRVTILGCLLAVTIASAAPVFSAEHGRPASTPAQLVETYASLADTILAAKKTEWNLVHSILASTYLHAQGTFAQASRKIEAGQNARVEIEQLAALVSQIANEGDASVAAIRKRLVEGGHHHNAKGEEQGVYEEGFVIVTREAKKAFLKAAGSIGKLGSAPDAAKLAAQWQIVQDEFGKLHP
jgi:hypothetical protein